MCLWCVCLYIGDGMCVCVGRKSGHKNDRSHLCKHYISTCSTLAGFALKLSTSLTIFSLWISPSYRLVVISAKCLFSPLGHIATPSKLMEIIILEQKRYDTEKRRRSDDPQSESHTSGRTTKQILTKPKTVRDMELHAVHMHTSTEIHTRWLAGQERREKFQVIFAIYLIK